MRLGTEPLNGDVIFPKLRWAADHYRIVTALRRKECLPSKHDARFHTFYLFLWLFNLFNNLGILLFAQS